LNIEVKLELINQRIKNTIITKENWIVFRFVGLKVKMAFAKYEKTDAVTKATELETKANQISDRLKLL